MRRAVLSVDHETLAEFGFGVFQEAGLLDIDVLSCEGLGEFPGSTSRRNWMNNGSMHSTRSNGGSKSRPRNRSTSISSR